MDVRAGYKKTEVGVIPEDWRLTPLEDICLFENGDRSSNYPSPNSFVSDGIPFINAGHVADGKITLSAMSYIKPESYHRLGGGKVRAGDILFCLRGSLGKFGVVSDGFGEGAIASSLVIIRPKPSSLIRSYLRCYLSSALCKRMIETWAGGAAQPNLGAGDLGRFMLPLPPSQAEQRAIATALSDVDALLAAQDKLIAKKRDIKQAAMQQLLTGKQRLPGFSGEWEVKRLGDICWYQEGPGVRNYQFTKQGVKLLNGTNIVNGKVSLDTTNRYISEDEAFGSYKHFLVDDGDILIASSGVTIDKFHEKVAFASSEHLPLCMNTSTIRFKPNSTELLNEFLYFFLQSDLFKEPIGKQATGSAQLNFGPAHLKKINVNLPPKMEEQAAIATALSDMDAEIAVLEQQRDKTCALKQGMMQELLTGRIRLVNEENRDA